MMGPNFMDEIDCGSFFDQIDDLIDFPSENDSGAGAGGVLNSGDFPTIWATPSDPLPGADPIFPGNNSHNNSPSDLSAELSVPYEDIVQLEWLSNFVEDSFSGRGMTLSKEHSSTNKDSSSHNSQFQTSSPVSVLESSSSCSGGGKVMPLSPVTHRGPHRARSKRPRPATFNPRPAIQLISPTSSITDNNSHPFLAPLLLSSESENYADSRPMKKKPKPSTAGEQQKKKKKTKPSFPPGTTTLEANQSQNQNQNSLVAVRKCLHCEITKTPQWRAGPMGPKTLCNACGVRYKSGRLFPEYRPAASPTFVPALHSNSHKKVVEMRTKIVEKTLPMIPKIESTEVRTKIVEKTLPVVPKIELTEMRAKFVEKTLPVIPKIESMEMRTKFVEKTLPVFPKTESTEMRTKIVEKTLPVIPKMESMQLEIVPNCKIEREEEEEEYM